MLSVLQLFVHDKKEKYFNYSLFFNFKTSMMLKKQIEKILVVKAFSWK